MSDVIVDIRNVRKEFGSGHTRVVAVKNVSLTAKEGEVILILGPSGSGKTTLLSMIGCILQPTSGKIFIHDKEISSLKEDYLPEIRRKWIGFVFQGFNLLKALTVEENVEVALTLNNIKGKAAKEKARHILTEVGLKERMKFYPVDLSGGEKQRVSIARALVTDPKIILADEPTGNLDSQSGRKISTMLHKLAKERGASVIVVTHDSRIEDIGDRILYLEDGMIKESSDL